MNFDEFLYITELGFLIESPVLSGPAIGRDSIYVDPKSGKSWRVNQKIDQLKKIKERYQSDSLYVHFSDGVEVNTNLRKKTKMTKLGINPMAIDGGTPIGIYAYPIDYVINKSGRVPYGYERAFMLIFKAKKENILYASKQYNEITDFAQMLDLLSKNKIQDKLKKTIRNKINNFKKIIEKTIKKSKEEAIEKIPKNLTNFIFKKIESVLHSEAFEAFDGFEEDWQDFLETKIEKIKNKLNKFEDPENFFYEHYDAAGAVKYWIKNLFPKKINEKIQQFDFDNLKIIFNNDPEFKEEWNKWWAEFNDINPPNANENNIDNEISFFDLIKRFISKEVSDWTEEASVMGAFSYLVVKKHKTDIFKYKMFEKIIEKLENLFKEIKTERKKMLSDFNFPFKEQFIKIADEYNVDLTECLIELLKRWAHGSSRSYGGNRNNNTSNFVYKFSGIIAEKIKQREWNEKGRRKKQYVVWTQILKKIGFGGIIDEEDSGTIHGGERTQAVFFDPSQIDLVAYIKNRSDITEKSLDWDAKDSILLRWQKGIENSIQLLNNGGYGYYKQITSKISLINSFMILNRILIILHSYFRFATQIEKENPGGNKAFKQTLKNTYIFGNGAYGIKYFLKNFDANVSPISQNEDLMKYANYLRDVLTKIINYIESDDLKVDLPKPSIIRGVIQNISKFSL